VSLFFYMQFILLQHPKYELIKFLQGNIFFNASHMNNT